MLQEAAEMKKYDNISTRAETGRCSGVGVCEEQSNKGIKQGCRSGKHSASGQTPTHSVDYAGLWDGLTPHSEQ